MAISKKISSLSSPSSSRQIPNDQPKTPITAAFPPPRPIPNSYWATSSLLACEYPWSPDTPTPKLNALLRAGVRTFIDLTEADELSPYLPHLASLAALQGIDASALEYYSFPIPDRALPKSREYVGNILRVLVESEARGRVSAVHCRGGIGRTGVVVGCWLVESGRVGCGEEALGRIAREWRTVEKCKRFPHSPETGPQFEFVKNFQRVLVAWWVVPSAVLRSAEFTPALDVCRALSATLFCSGFISCCAYHWDTLVFIIITAYMYTIPLSPVLVTHPSLRDA